MEEMPELLAMSRLFDVWCNPSAPVRHREHRQMVPRSPVSRSQPSWRLGARHHGGRVRASTDSLTPSTRSKKPMSVTSVVASLAGCLLLLVACDNVLQPGRNLRVRIVAGASTDTIDSRSTIIAEVRGPLGQPATGVEVVFEASRADGDQTDHYTLFLLRPGCCGGRPLLATTRPRRQLTPTRLVPPSPR